MNNRVSILKYKILLKRKVSDLLRRKQARKAFSSISIFVYTIIKYLSIVERSQLIQQFKYKTLLSSIRQDIQVLCNRRQDIHLYISEINKYLPLGEYNKDLSLRRSIVLKKPVFVNGDAIEKGVLLITFTNSLEYFIRHINLEKLLSHYYIVLEPSWSGYCDPRILYWMKFNRHNIIIEAPEIEDYKFIELLDSNLIPVDFGASDWVDDRIFYPIEPINKIYDVVYVAGYGAYKRHHVLFRAVKDLRDTSLRVALVGFPWRGTRLEIDTLIDYYGIHDNIEIFEKLRPEEVNQILNASKVNVLLSLREGSNRSIFEGLFAGVPAIVLQDNIGVQKKYINEMTGMLIDENDLPSAISYFRENWHNYKPHQWAVNNISPPITTNKLNNVLKKIAIKCNEQWTSDIISKVNAPEVDYYNASDKLLFRRYNEDMQQSYGNEYMKGADQAFRHAERE